MRFSLSLSSAPGRAQPACSPPGLTAVLFVTAIRAVPLAITQIVPADALPIGAHGLVFPAGVESGAQWGLGDWYPAGGDGGRGGRDPGGAGRQGGGGPHRPLRFCRNREESDGSRGGVWRRTAPSPACARMQKEAQSRQSGRYGETPFTQPLSSTNCSHAVSHAWNPNPSCRLKAAASEDYLPLPPSQGGGLVKTESQGTPRKTHGGLSRPQKKTPHHSHPRQKRLRSRGVRCSATLGVHIPRCHRQTPEGHTRGARAPLWGREKRN